jgi:hypothetical protein
LSLAPLAAFTACSGAPSPPSEGAGPSGLARPAEQPALVVTVVVDQLRADLLERYDTLFTGGLRRLLDQGLRFPGASHRHAYTETAPGHATLATGVHPSRHGIVANGFYDLQDDGTLWLRYAVDDSTSPVLGYPDLGGRSPSTLLADGLADWVLAADGASRVLSVSKKDRAAITMGGRASDAERVHVYWMHVPARRFVTSAFYRDQVPPWVERFNETQMPELLGDTVWAQSTPVAARALARPDSAPYESDGVHVTFPHLRSAEAGPGEARQNGWYESTPYPDAALMAFTAAAMEALELGRRGVLDHLAISFSQTDLVGHRYGPLSQEQLDNLLHLDRVLDELLSLLDARVGSGRWVLGFSADHGVLTMPEYLAEQGVGAFRSPREDLDALARRVQEDANPTASDAQVVSDVIRAIEAVPYVARVYTPADLANPADTFALLFRNSDHPRRRAGDLPAHALLVRRTEHALVTSAPGGTSHGSPYWYDRSVPLVLLGAGIEPGSDAGAAYTVDLAPTLAWWAGIRFPGDLDGRALGGGG